MCEGECGCVGGVWVCEGECGCVRGSMGVCVRGSVDV